MFQTPNSKSIGSVAVMAGAGVVGAKLSDGIVAIMPDSTAKYSKVLVAGLALLGAASVNAKTTTGQAVQASLVGAVIKQGADALTEMLSTSVDPQDNTTVTGKFINAVVGHSVAKSPVSYPKQELPAETLAKLGNPSFIDWAPAQESQIPLGV